MKLNRDLDFAFDVILNGNYDEQTRIAVLKIIQTTNEALKLSLNELRSYANLPNGMYIGPDDLYYDLGEGAKDTLKKIKELHKN